MRNLQARGRVALLGAAASVLLTAASAHAVATLTFSDAEIEPGATGQITLSLDDGGDEIAGTSNEVGFPSELTVGNCEANEAINKGGTSFTEGNPFIALVLSLTNVDPIPTGSVLYTCDVTVAEGTADGDYTVDCEAPAASDPDGNEISADCVDGTITVLGPPAGTITIGDAEGLPGSTTSVDVTLSVAEGQTIVGTENLITFGTPGGSVAAVLQGATTGGIQVTGCEVNPAINKGGTAFAFQPTDCTTDCASVKALVLSLTDVEPIPDGSVMYTCDVAISADAEEGDTFPLTCSEAGASDPEGGELRVNCVDGTVTVIGEPTPAPTATPIVIGVARAQLSAAIGAGDTELTISNVVGTVPSSGILEIDGERIRYSSLTNNGDGTFTLGGLERGIEETTAASHAQGAIVDIFESTAVATPTRTAGATSTPVQPTVVPATNTPDRRHVDDDGCAVAPAQSSTGWTLLLPLAALLWLRRRQK